jgi:hypothetical protein
MASFACHHDRRLGSFLTKNTPILLDTTTNGTENELRPISNGGLNLQRRILSHDDDISTHGLFG